MYIAVADAGFQKGRGGGRGKKCEQKFLVTPPQQLVIDHVELCKTTKHAHNNAASAILWQVHMHAAKQETS